MIRSTWGGAGGGSAADAAGRAFRGGDDRAGRARETVSLSRDALVIRKVQPNGRASEIFFNPYWVRLEVSEVEDEGVTKIEVRSRNEIVPVGAMVVV